MAAVETKQTVRAQAKWVRSSARKARLVTDLVRGRTVPEARTVLAFSQRAVARDVEKVLRSAVANAEQNHGLRGDDLLVAAAFADEGRTLKRFRPRARGRVGPIKKRTCHITIELAPTNGATLPAARPAPAAQPEAAAPEPQAEAKPKRAPRARKTDAPAAEEKPKRRTTRKKKTEESES